MAGCAVGSKVYTVCYNRGLTYDRYEWFPIGKVRAAAQLAAVALQLAPEPSI